MAEIQLHRDGSVLIVTIANESKYNAFTHAMTSTLGSAFRDAEDDESIRCVIVTGAGRKAFSSGHDLSELLQNRELAANEALNEPFYMPQLMTKPVIAAVNGVAHAGGLILALSCDIRICEPAADFAAPGARIGLLPIGGQISRLPGLIPHGVAYEMLATARRVSADEAHRLGFVNHVAEPGQLMGMALATAKQIAANSPAVLAMIKKGLKLRAAEGERAASQFEWEEGGRLQCGPDADEGVRAFLEKRVPKF
ncbi:MAG: enoyl-CoA hydratase/isomerase family protein [Alcaligenaceae bacterium]|nr:enoyl-CoA hydratase/isomerase family protein [Alcaligenaceae bacterium]